eukprot:scaffold1092_cov19-Tisochrysis_lutea.AAC.2
MFHWQRGGVALRHWRQIAGGSASLAMKCTCVAAKGVDQEAPRPWLFVLELLTVAFGPGPSLARSSRDCYSSTPHQALCVLLPAYLAVRKVRSTT